MLIDVKKIKVPHAMRAAAQVWGGRESVYLDVKQNGIPHPLKLMGPTINGHYVLMDESDYKYIYAAVRLHLREVKAYIKLPPSLEWDDPTAQFVRMNSAGKVQGGGRPPGYKSDRPTKRQLEKNERRAKVLPLLQDGLPTREISQRLGYSQGTIQDDKRFFIDNGQLIGEDVTAVHKSVAHVKVGSLHAERVLDNVAVMLSGITSSLDSLRLEDLEVITSGDEWEKAFKDVVRAINRVRRTTKKGSDDHHGD